MSDPDKTAPRKNDPGASAAARNDPEQKSAASGAVKAAAGTVPAGAPKTGTRKMETAQKAASGRKTPEKKVSQEKVSQEKTGQEKAPGGKTPQQKAGGRASGRGLRAVGLIAVLLVITLGSAAALYPLWRDRAAGMMAQGGVPFALPEIPDIRFYNAVSAIFAAPESGVASAVAEAEPDPLVQLAGRVRILETRLGRLSGDVDALRSQMQDTARAVEAAAAEPAVQNVSPEDMAALSARINILQGRLEELAARPVTSAAAPVPSRPVSSAATNGAGAVNAALLESVGRLRERIAALEARETVTPSALDAAEGRIGQAGKAAEERIAGLEAGLEAVRRLAEKRAPERERAGLFLLAVGQLEAVVAGSGAYGARLSAVRDLAATDSPEIADMLEVLTGHAAGVESRASLASRFPDVAQRVSRAALAGSDEGFVGKTLNTVAALVTIRRTDRAEGPGTDAILVRAGDGLEAGDLAGAVAALGALEGPPAAGAADWLVAAKARLAVDAAVAGLRDAALALVAKAG